MDANARRAVPPPPTTTVTVYDTYTGATLMTRPAELAAALLGSGWYPDLTMTVREAIVKMSWAVRRGEYSDDYAAYLGVVVDLAESA